MPVTVTAAVSSSSPAAGQVMASCGPRVSRVTVNGALAVLWPRLSLAVAWSELAPSVASGTPSTTHWLPLTTAATPLTATAARCGSSTVPVTVTTASSVSAGSDAASTPSSGARVSRTTSTVGVVAALPAASTAVAVSELPPSTGSGTATAVKRSPTTVAVTPLTVTALRYGSSTVPSTVMVVVATTLPSLGPSTVTLGAVASTTTVTLALPVRPVSSTASAVSRCSPSLRVRAAVKRSPLRVAITPSTSTRARWASSTVPVTTTVVSGKMLPGTGPSTTTTGAVVSSSSTTWEVVVQPARSVTLSVTRLTPSARASGAEVKPRQSPLGAARTAAAPATVSATASPLT